MRQLALCSPSPHIAFQQKREQEQGKWPRYSELSGQQQQQPNVAYEPLLPSESGLRFSLSRQL